MTSHSKRLITGFVLFIIVSIIFVLQGLILQIFGTIIAIISVLEFIKMFNDENKLLPQIVALLISIGLSYIIIYKPTFGLIALIASFWILAMTYLVQYSLNREVSFKTYMIIFCSIIYITLPIAITTKFSTIELFFIVTLAIGNDAGAFYGGKFFGNRKIWPAISPKKTWAGAYAGVIGSTCISLFFGLIWGRSSISNFFIIGILAAIATQLGDFFESALKRKQGIKDSGCILPGHGGILDRIDGLLFVILLYSTLSHFIPYFHKIIG